MTAINPALAAAIAAQGVPLSADLAVSGEPTTCADESLDVGCKDGKCTCPCGIPCTCGSCCGCCTVYCGHAYDCESVNPTPTQAEMFAHFDYMLSAPYRFPPAVTS